jgi:transposase
VIVANARELKWITASDTKNDSTDARKLALLARADVKLLAPVEHRTAEQQAQLAVIRARTLLINSARGIAKGSAYACLSRLPPRSENGRWRTCRRCCERRWKDYYGRSTR